MDRGGGKAETEKHRNRLDQKHNSAVVAWPQAGRARLVPREGSSAPVRPRPRPAAGPAGELLGDLPRQALPGREAEIKALGV